MKLAPTTMRGIERVKKGGPEFIEEAANESECCTLFCTGIQNGKSIIARQYME